MGTFLQQSLYPSIRLLVKNCHQYLKGKFYLFGGGVSFQWNSGEKITNLILFGHPTELLKSEYIWPTDRKFRFYTLSHAHKELLINAFPKFQKKQISVIPRYAIFPIKKKTSLEMINWNRSLKLIFSGRFEDQDKNLDVVTKVAHCLQTVYDIDLELVICGPGKNSSDIHFSELKWKKQPIFLGDLGTNWLKKISGNKVLMHFSTSVREDFGVSIAQAQELGLPVILSDWGGHKDVDQGIFIKIPARLIKQGKKNERAIRKIAELCLKNGPKASDIQEKETRPQEIGYKQIIEIQKSYRKLGTKRINQILG